MGRKKESRGSKDFVPTSMEIETVRNPKATHGMRLRRRKKVFNSGMYGIPFGRQTNQSESSVSPERGRIFGKSEKFLEEFEYQSEEESSVESPVAEKKSRNQKRSSKNQKSNQRKS